jgi:hypothetical protein
MIAVLVSGQITAKPEFKTTADNRKMVVSAIKGRLGRDNSEGWQLLAYVPAARHSLLRLQANEYVAVQGVPSTRIAKIGGEHVIQRLLFVEHVLSLKPEGGPNAALL